MPYVLKAQHTGLYSKDWEKVDSLLQKGFPESAGKIVEGIYAQAKQKKQSLYMLKAQLFLLEIAYQQSEEGFEKIIHYADSMAVSAPFPENALWNSMAASLYWQYYQQNRWEILGRTQVSASENLESFAYWDARRFFETIQLRFQRSLEHREKLQQIPLSEYYPLIDKGKNTELFRTTLFDFLAFRALAYYAQDEKDLARPAFAFTIYDEEAFAPASRFMNYDFQTRDTASLQWQALSLYKLLLKAHIQDVNPDAFLDADLHRLEFVYQYSTHPNKRTLYLDALSVIEKQYKDHPLSALAAVRAIQVEMQIPQKSPRPFMLSSVPQKEQVSYPELKNKLEKIVAAYPGSEGATIAQSLLNMIIQKQLMLTLDEVIIPGKVSKFLISYKNLSKAWYRVYQLPVMNKEKNIWDSVSLQKNMSSAKIVLSRELVLPASEDHQMHYTEAILDGLSEGTYMLVMSTDPDFNFNNQILSQAIFQVSNLALIYPKQGPKGFVLHRDNGYPIPGVSVHSYVREYDRSSRAYKIQKLDTDNTLEDGSFKFPDKKDSHVNLLLTHGNDSLYLENIYKYTIRNNTNSRTETFLFTDRSIYRPGQNIYYKGIVVTKPSNAQNTSVLANHPIEVILYDANRQEVARIKHQTNEFGSFSGSFKAPENLLKGNFQIYTQYGSAYISIEEYKRPKFYVALDTLMDSYRVGDTINVTGKALAFAGNSISEAQVKYRVVRKVFYPYRWYAYCFGFPTASTTEILQGSSKTLADGSFSLSFVAAPDLQIPQGSMPVFTYEIIVDVTDINGETQSGDTRIQAGYTSVLLSVQAPKVASPKQMNSLTVKTTNLQGVFVPEKIKLIITKLQEPGRVLRQRQWQTPDQFIIDSVTYAHYFPDDVYKNEDDPLLWNAKKVVHEVQWETKPTGNITLPTSIWDEPGYYQIEVQANEQTSTPLIEKLVVYLTEEGKGYKSVHPLLAIPNTVNASPKTDVEISLETGYDDLYILSHRQHMQKSEPITPLIKDNKPVRSKYTVQESDRGGLMHHFVAIKNNRVYTQQVFVEIPWNNKDLAISWETHRDKLLPGAQETWTMVIKGHQKDKVAAEMVATLYDASLDQIKPHRWNRPNVFPKLYTWYYGWEAQYGFGHVQGSTMDNSAVTEVPVFTKQYPQLRFFISQNYGRVYMKNALFESQVMSAGIDPGGVALSDAGEEKSGVSFMPSTGAKDEEIIEEVTDKVDEVIAVRKNLQELAFFYPDLKTDESGNIRFSFTMPEALTRWNLMAFAHTPDMQTGMLTGSVQTQKDIMVQPNLPRFFRQGDEIWVTAKIANMRPDTISGIATIQLTHAITGKDVNTMFSVTQANQDFYLASAQNTLVQWKVRVPESLYEPVIVQIRAHAGNHTDGEEQLVPVQTNRMWITETLPLWMNGSGTKAINFPSLQQAASPSRSTQNLVVTYTTQPVWYAVMALPYLMEYPYEGAEQIFNRYYAHAVAAHILQNNPDIAEVIKQWQKDGTTLTSVLEQNKELKYALLQATPWVRDALDEQSQRNQLAKLLDAASLQSGMDAAIQKLQNMQMPDGGFGWFKGMQSNPFITQYIVSGIGKLYQAGVIKNNIALEKIVEEALTYMDKRLKQTYERQQKKQEHSPSYLEIQYFYARSFYKHKIPSATQVAYQYYLTKLKDNWHQHNPYLKGMIALTLHRNGDQQLASLILQSLRETSIRHEELGMYWQYNPGFRWDEAPIETQALMISCFHEIANDQPSVDAMKRWLLKHKQVNHWPTTKATADACYALLYTGTHWLEHTTSVHIRMGDKEVSSELSETTKGTGFFSVVIPRDEVKPEMSDISFTVNTSGASPSWGSVHWQYFEDMQHITSAGGHFSLTKELYLVQNTEHGPELIPVTRKGLQVQPLQLGDKVMVRITLATDRDMEYIHVQDMRGSCFEPMDQLSGYRWNGGLGYYQSAGDMSTDFFIDKLPKGKYVLEYPVFVNQNGKFSNGITTVQSMYAPEFSGHSGGVVIQSGN